jgi:hypothetical protein
MSSCVRARKAAPETPGRTVRARSIGRENVDDRLCRMRIPRAEIAQSDRPGAHDTFFPLICLGSMGRVVDFAQRQLASTLCRYQNRVFAVRDWTRHEKRAVPVVKGEQAAGLGRRISFLDVR